MKHSGMNAGGISLSQKCPSMVLICSGHLDLFSNFIDCFVRTNLWCFLDPNNLYCNEGFMEFCIWNEPGVHATLEAYG